MSSFFSEFMEYTRELESPTSYFQWASYAIVAAVLRDNVYLDQGTKRLFPNVYVLLIGESGAHRKDTPLSIAGGLVGKVKNTKIIQGRASVQAILEILSSPFIEKNSTNAPLTGGSCFLCANELSAFIVQDPQAIPILTDIYDSRPEWTSALKGGGNKTIKNLCVTLLGASNETLLKQVYTDLATHGGLMARTFFVKPNELRPANALFGSQDLGKKYDPLPLIKRLIAISKLRGGFIVSADAHEMYKNWYTKIRIQNAARVDKSGVMGRIHTGVAKLAMILAVGYTEQLIIEKEHVEEAIDRCKSILPNYEIFVISSGKSKDADVGSLLFSALYAAEKHTIDRRAFLRENWTEIDVDVLDGLLSKLDQAGIIKMNVNFATDVTEYTLTDSGLTKLKDKMGK